MSIVRLRASETANRHHRSALVEEARYQRLMSNIIRDRPNPAKIKTTLRQQNHPRRPFPRRVNCEIDPH
jgi:hypothetical protein